MKITYHTTEAQYNAHVHGRKAPRGTSYKAPNNKRTDTDKYHTLKTFVTAVAFFTLLTTIYLSF